MLLHPSQEAVHPHHAHHHHALCNRRVAWPVMCAQRTGAGGAGSGGNRDGSGASLTPTSFTSSAVADTAAGLSGAATRRTATA
jgi:hypothetical protein